MQATTVRHCASTATTACGCRRASSPTTNTRCRSGSIPRAITRFTPAFFGGRQRAGGSGRLPVLDAVAVIPARELGRQHDVVERQRSLVRWQRRHAHSSQRVASPRVLGQQGRGLGVCRRRSPVQRGHHQRLLQHARRRLCARRELLGPAFQRPHRRAQDLRGQPLRRGNQRARHRAPAVRAATGFGGGAARSR